MFGISLPKLMVLVAVVAAVWFGFKYVAQIQNARDAQGNDRPARRGRGSAARRPDDGPAAEEMVQCPVCQDFVQARGTTACGRENCPY